MNRTPAVLLSLLALTSCGGDPKPEILKAWADFRAAVTAEDWKATLHAVSSASRDDAMRKAEFFKTLPPKSLPPYLAAKAGPDETAPWSAERIAGETLLLDLKGLWQVPQCESPGVESVAGNTAYLVVSRPGVRTRWTLLREGDRWTFHVESTISSPVAPGDGPPNSAECQRRLKQLGISVALYESRFKTYPENLDDLLKTGLADNERLTRCACGSSPVYTWRRPAGDQTSPDFIMACDPVPHSDGMRNVLYFQGRGDVFNEAEFQKKLLGPEQNPGPSPK